MKPDQINSAMQQAVADHSAGRLAEAERIYRQVLSISPNHADALHLLGVIALQVGNPKAALELIDRAITSAPNMALYHQNLAASAVALKDIDRAVNAYRRALELDPRNAETLIALAELLLTSNHPAQAIDPLRKAIQLQPRESRLHLRLGAALRNTNQLSEAIKSYQTALAMDPTQAEGWSDLSAMLLASSQYEEAFAAAEKSVQLKPTAIGYVNLSAALLKLDRVFEADTAAFTACELDPKNVEALVNHSITLLHRGWVQEAIDRLREAAALRPESKDIEDRLARALFTGNHLEEAAESFRRRSEENPTDLAAKAAYADTLCAINPDSRPEQIYRQILAQDPTSAFTKQSLAILLHRRGELAESRQLFTDLISEKPDDYLRWERAMVDLDAGNYLTGWADYEGRLSGKSLELEAVSKLGKPRWDGSPLNGKTILISAEQGLGDTLQFCRYIPAVRDAGGRVIFRCQPELLRLLAPLDGVSQIFSWEDEPPAFDTYAWLMSLPHLFKTELETVPANIPYVHTDPGLVAKWRGRAEQLGEGLKVGLAWAGRPKHRMNNHRSLPAQLLEPLSKARGVKFVSLQLNATEPPPVPHVDWSADLTDMAETAAALEALDHLITVDSSLAHLAGALGKPVWTLIAFVHDYRWMLDRADTPWYPTMKLYRQPGVKQWPVVIERMKDDLSRLAAEGKHKRSGS